jgi:DNA-binding CsgD family transcriptional regulator
MKIFLSFILVLALITSGLAQEDITMPGNKDTITEALVKKYLSDTLNASAKINELISLSQAQNTKYYSRSEAIRIYQVGLTLVPYAKDSFEIISKLHAGFAGELYQAGALDLAVEYLHKALYYQRKANKEPDGRSYNLLGKIGSFYLRYDQLDSAAKYYNLTVEEARQVKNPLWIAAAYNNQGILLAKQRKYNEARVSYTQALNAIVLRDHGDSSLHGSIIDNFGELALDMDDPQGAKAFYAVNLEMYEPNGSIEDKYKTHAGLAKVFVKLGDITEATRHLNLLNTYLNFGKPAPDIDHRIRYHELWKSLYAKQKDWRKYADAQEQITYLKDSVSLFNKRQLNDLLQALTYSQIYQFRKDIQLHQMELTQAHVEARQERYITIVIGALGTSILILLYVYYRNRHRLQLDKIELHEKDQLLAEAELRNKQLQQEQLQKELHYKKKDISGLALYLSKLKDLNDSMLEKLEEVKNTKPEDQKAAIRTMTNELGAMIHSQEKVSMMQENIDVVNKEFSATLLAQYPDLTKSEIELCGFFRMNMSSKEIGLLKNISPQSVKMARYRLRKKFALASETDIYKFLSNM